MTIDILKSKNLILFEVIAGSRAFGLDTPTSDTDIKGVFYMPREQFYGLDYIPQISNETNDIVYYEIGRFVELLLKNNPNILEILATPHDCILYIHPIMNKLRIDDFLSKLCKDTFAGYASTQIKKARGLKKKIVNPIPQEKKNLLSFCYILDGPDNIQLEVWLHDNNLLQEKCGLINIAHSKGVYALYYDDSGNLGYKGIIQKETANEVSVSSIPKGEKEQAYLFVNQDRYSIYCKEYREYWEWIEKRNDDRYHTNLYHGKNYDSKNMMHTIRLLQLAEQILKLGQLNIRVNNREELLDIKAGKREYDELLKLADALLSQIEHSYTISDLTEFPDKAKAEQILVEIRTELYN